MNLEKRLREARESHGWTQAQVAKWAGLTAIEVAHYELGRRKPRPENLKKLAIGLRVSVDWLLGLDSERPGGLK